MICGFLSVVVRHRDVCLAAAALTLRRSLPAPAGGQQPPTAVAFADRAVHDLLNVVTSLPPARTTRRSPARSACSCRSCTAAPPPSPPATPSCTPSTPPALAGRRLAALTRPPRSAAARRPGPAVSLAALRENLPRGIAIDVGDALLASHHELLGDPAAVWPGWRRGGLLPSVADAIQPASETVYINGQHRAQAMLEAGVRRTVVLHQVYET